MPSQPTAVPAQAAGLYRDYLAWLAARGVGNKPFYSGARNFLARYPNPQDWADLPLPQRLAADSNVRPLLNYLMLHGHLQPGYDYLLERKLSAILREAKASPIASELDQFATAAEQLGYSSRSRTGMASQVATRMLIQTGRRLVELDAADFAAFDQAIGEREQHGGRALGHYRHALYGSRAVIYHLGSPAEPVPKRSTLGRWSWQQHLGGVPDGLRHAMVAYLERCSATLTRSTVSATASELAHFGRFLASHDHALVSFADLDRRLHIEPYLNQVAAARNHRTGQPIAASTQRERIQAVGHMLEAMAEWGWPDAPSRRLIFNRDCPRLPRPLPRYLPPDQDRRLVAALQASPHRLRADALLVARATGVRVGELIDLELDCVHEVPGQGAWLKVPLGKLATERMVPIDEDTLAVIDRIVEHRSPGRPLRHPRDGRLVEFLLTHQGRRVSADTLRDELHRAADDAGIGPVTPHQLRHTFATAMVNAGCSLQSLMSMLGHVSAEMSLRYGRLFDATVRADYEKALTVAKEHLGPMPQRVPAPLEGDWRHLPLVKARLAGGYCVRTLAQGTCPYTNICEHCPNFRSDATFLPTLMLQRADTQQLLEDAERRGWGEEATRHRRLADRLDRLIETNQTA